MSESTVTGVQFGSGTGAVSITTAGALSIALLNNLEALLNSESVNAPYTDYTKGDPVPTTPAILVISTDPVVALEDTVVGVVAIAAATIYGGGAGTAVLSDGLPFNYTGGAGTVFGSSFSNDIVSTADSAVIGVAIGDSTLLAAGSGDKITLSQSAGNTMGVTLVGGSDSVSVEAANAITATDVVSINAAGGSGSNVFALGSDTLGGNVVLHLATADTVFGGVAGASTIFAGGSDQIFGGSGSGVFFGAAGSSTFIGAASGGSDTIHTGSTGDLIFGDGSSDVIVTGGGSDTVAGGSVAPTIFATSGSDLHLIATAATGVLVDIGNNTTLDASGSTNSNVFFSSAQYGNTTLIGSSSASDTFVVSHGSVGGATITIENFNATSGFLLAGFSADDNAAATSALTAGSSVTLSDGTTISFVGNHPTTVHTA